MIADKMCITHKNQAKNEGEKVYHLIENGIPKKPFQELVLRQQQKNSNVLQTRE